MAALKHAVTPQSEPKVDTEQAKRLAGQAAEAARAGRLDEARRHYAEATRLAPDRANWWAAYGRVLMRLSDEPGAARCYRTALRLKPDMAIWRVCLSELQRRRWRLLQRPAGLALSAGFYDAGYKVLDKYKCPGDDSVYRPVWERVLELLATYDAQAVADLGCGPGQFAEFVLKRRPMTYDGYDFSAEAIAMAEAKGLAARFHCLDLVRSRGAIAATYDTVVATEFLEHVTEDLAVLAGLKPGAAFIGSVPNFDSFGHVRYFTTAAEVEARYGPLLDKIAVVAVPISGASEIFIFHGRIKGRSRG